MPETQHTISRAELIAYIRCKQKGYTFQAREIQLCTNEINLDASAETHVCSVRVVSMESRMFIVLLKRDLK